MHISEIKNQILKEFPKYIPFPKEVIERGILERVQEPELERAIKELITEQILKATKLKSEIQFQNFFELYQNEFWEFRALNSDKEIVNPKHPENKEFEEKREKMRNLLYKYESILTRSTGFHHSEGLGKLAAKWQGIVERYFPLIEVEYMIKKS